MSTQKKWIERYKSSKCFYSYYQLAKHWNIDTSVMSKLLSDTRKLSLEQYLMIAVQLNVEPLEIIIDVEYKRKNKPMSDFVKGIYFDQMTKSVGDRMFSNAKYYRRR